MRLEKGKVLYKGQTLFHNLSPSQQIMCRNSFFLQKPTCKNFMVELQ